MRKKLSASRLDHREFDMRAVAIVCAALIGASILCCSPMAALAKTAKECRVEWQANKADNQAKKITEKEYVKQCAAGGTAAQPATPPAAKTTKQAEPKTAPAAATKTERTIAPAPAAPPARPAAAATGTYQYTTEAQAKARCGSGAVVWANLNSKIYHFAGHKDYGNTKSGAYMCEHDATTEGMRAAKNEKHP
jgi:hypothetical protein